MSEASRGSTVRYRVDLWDSKLLRYRYPVDLDLEVAFTAHGVPYARSITLTVDDSEHVAFVTSSTEPSESGQTLDGTGYRGDMIITKELLRDVASGLNRLVDDVVAAVQLEQDLSDGKEVPIGRTFNGDLIYVREGSVVSVDAFGTEHLLEDFDADKPYVYRALADRARKQRVSRSAWTDEKIQNVAAVFREANAHGRSTRADVMRAMGVESTQAGALIKEARNRGYLPPARKGRKQDS